MVDANPAFGKWLRAQRKALDLTQEELARRVGCALVTIQKIEEGRRRPSQQIVGLLAQHLQIPADEREAFERLARPQPPAPALPFPGLTPPPAPLTSFIGRQAELEFLQQTLAASAVRLLTLVGPPGVGKTRLALQTAAQLRPAFPDGVCFVPLSNVFQPELVLPTIAYALGFAQADPQQLLPRLQAGLQARRILLILDNFEQIASAAPQISALLSACPTLKALVSSRLPLKISGEALLQVDPLPLPKAGEPYAQLEQNAAVSLFLDRVRLFQPSFQLTPQNTPLILEICALCEGLPLTLELAAARLRRLSLAELVGQLRQSALQLPADELRDLPPRQRSLQAAIRWSYSLLEPPAQRLFQQAGLFAGSFDFPAAQAVCEIASPEELAALVEHSLLRRLEAPGDQPRFAMLETLRRFALDRLAESEAYLPAQRRHTAYYFALAQPPNEDTAAWFARCEREHDNLRLALQTALHDGDRLLATQFCTRLRWFWETHGYQREALAWFEAALGLPGPLPPLLHVQALQFTSVLSWQLGNFPLARQHSHTALEICRQAFPTAVSAEESASLQAFVSLLWVNLARIALEEGAYDQALSAAEQGLAVARQLQDRELEASSLLHMGEAALELGDRARAVEYLQEGLAVLPAPASNFWEALIWYALGSAWLEQGDRPQAYQCMRQALQLAQSVQHIRPLTLAQATLGALQACDPELSPAERLEGVRLYRRVLQRRNCLGLAFAPGHRRRLEALLEQARQTLSAEAWEAAWRAEIVD